MHKAGDYCSQSPYLAVTVWHRNNLAVPRCDQHSERWALSDERHDTQQRERTVLRKHQLDAKNSPGRSHMRGSVGVLAWQNHHLHMRHDWKFFS